MNAKSVTGFLVALVSVLGINFIPLEMWLYHDFSGETLMIVYGIENVLALLLGVVFVLLFAPRRDDSSKIRTRREVVQLYLLLGLTFSVGGLGARFLPVTEVLKNSEIITSEAPRDVFELGFTTESGKLERGARIKQVTSQSAIDAGLKPGDELRGFSFAYGKPQEQATFTIQRGEQSLQVKYFPKKTINVLQINENAKIPR